MKIKILFINRDGKKRKRRVKVGGGREKQGEGDRRAGDRRRSRDRHHRSSSE